MPTAARARESFENMLSVNPTDKTAKLYLQRINILLERGVPENWDGVWALTEK